MIEIYLNIRLVVYLQPINLRHSIDRDLTDARESEQPVQPPVFVREKAEKAS